MKSFYNNYGQKADWNGRDIRISTCHCDSKANKKSGYPKVSLDNHEILNHDLSFRCKKVNQTPSVENLLALARTYSKLGACFNQLGEYSEAKKCYLKGQIIRRAAKSNDPHQRYIGNNTHPYNM